MFPFGAAVADPINDRNSGDWVDPTDVVFANCISFQSEQRSASEDWSR